MILKEFIFPNFLEYQNILNCFRWSSSEKHEEGFQYVIKIIKIFNLFQTLLDTYF
jgi:hypothetical protein